MQAVELLKPLSPISLDAMDQVKLMDRRDTKFLFREAFLPFVLDELAKDYYVLEINGSRSQQYVSLYFDTPEFRFYLDHHNGRARRFKVRYRQYTGSGLHFLEVKRKNNLGRTKKRRIEIGREEYDSGVLHDAGRQFIAERMKYDIGPLAAGLSVSYARITLVHKGLKERATIDLDLGYNAPGGSKLMKGAVIAEVKQDRLSMDSPFVRLMRKYRLPDVRFSKYCFGVNLLYPEIKYNRFKPRILTFNRIIYGNL